MGKDYRSLDGIWEAHFSPHELEPGMAHPGHEWDFSERLEVPGYWQEQGYPFQGTVVYRKGFSWRADKPHYMLHLGAVDYVAEVWLNDIYLGPVESEYCSLNADVSHLLKEGENRLVVFVTSVLPAHPERKTQVKGANLHWDCVPCKQGPVNDPLVPSSSSERYPVPVLATGGIVGHVGLVGYDTLVCTQKSILTYLSQDLTRGTLCVRLGIYHKGRPGSYPVQVRLEPDDFEGDGYSFTRSVDLLPGLNNVQLCFEVAEPMLWWARDMGKQHLYKVKLTVHSPEGGVEEAWCQRTGFRRVARDDGWGLYLNNRRLFARGFDYMSSVFHRTRKELELTEDLELMLQANANMVRVFGHVTRDEFYSLCDRKGLLVFQDLPFQWGYSNTPDFIAKARAVASQIVLDYSHHPSIFLWCTHSEPRYVDFNKLSQVMSRAIKELDTTRPIIRNSVLALRGEEPQSVLDFQRFTRLTEKETANLSVCWTGWYWGKVEDVTNCNPWFVTEFGIQSLPNHEDLTPEVVGVEGLKQIGFQPDVFLKATGVMPDSLDELCRVSQEYQARSYEYHIEELRLKKYTNCNGLLAFHLVSTYPSADWSVVDHLRHPKMAYDVIRQKFQPVLPVASLKRVDKDEVAISVHVINDLHRELVCDSLTLNLVDGSGCELERGRLENLLVGADSVAEVGTLAFSPVAASQTVEIRLRLYSRAEGAFENMQRWRVVERLQKALRRDGG